MNNLFDTIGTKIHIVFSIMKNHKKSLIDELVLLFFENKEDSILNSHRSGQILHFFDIMELYFEIQGDENVCKNCFIRIWNCCEWSAVFVVGK